MCITAPVWHYIFHVFNVKKILKPKALPLEYAIMLRDFAMLVF